MNPKHCNPTKKRYNKDGNFWAYAPYNFVPLPEKVLTIDNVPNQDVYTHNTGYIECMLTTESPLYTRCAMTPDFFRENGDKSFDKLNDDEQKERACFFHHEDKRCPIIPGSSLRGMVRSLVEIAGYGKMQWVTNDKITYRAVAAAKDEPLAEPYKNVLGRYGNNVQAGYLIRKNDDWYVKPAKISVDLKLSGKKSYLIVKEKVIDEDNIPAFIDLNDKKYKPQYHEVSFNAEIRSGNRGKFNFITNIGAKDAGYKYHGVLVCSGNMLETGSDVSSPRKNHALVLEQNTKEKDLKITKQAITNYIEGLTPFQKEDPFNEHVGCLVNNRPIFYISVNGEVHYFGHSPNFRIPAIISDDNCITSPLDFVPDYITSKNKIDLADSIFGYVENKNSCAGRVFFTDAKLESASNGIWLTEDPITPQILASPNPTTFQHYLVQDGAKGHDPDKKVQLAHYATPTPNETVTRGHKRYWHKGRVGEDDIKEIPEKIEKSPTQYTQIKPVKDGVTFVSRIYFENLQDHELGALLWVLTLPGEEGKEYRHKLGMGKPLGLGSIRIEPKLYVSERSDRYKQLFKDNRWAEAVGEYSNAQKFIRNFEDYILKFLDEGNIRHLNKISRIEMLFKMLEWEGPDRSLTRYLNIEEFKERAVLPDPFNIEPPLS